MRKEKKNDENKRTLVITRRTSFEMRLRLIDVV
jgi:hypothetical protein